MTKHSDLNSERQKRKEEGKRKKRQRIAEAGGVRPRASSSKKNNFEEGEKEKIVKHEIRKDDSYSLSSPTKVEVKIFTTGQSSSQSNKYDKYNKYRNDTNNKSSSYLSRHRFGRVMENVPCRNKPRFSTVSIALPGSVLSNCQTKELRTLLVGQIARAATIYHVDEIIVFDDKLANNNRNGAGWREFKRRKHNNNNQEDGKKNDTDDTSTNTEEKDNSSPEQQRRQQQQQRSTHQEFMARLLQYCECPQYLRRNFFPMHSDLQFCGLLAPVDAPHHVRADDRSKYREGVVMNKNHSTNGNSFVNCGIRNRPVEIDRKLTPGVRCTVQIDPAAYGRPAQIKGIVVSPSRPREDDGTYWGFTTRMAKSINDVFEGCPFSEHGYDLKIGTSERGSKSVEDKSFGLPKYRHSLIVFGGVAGIEECVDADETIRLAGSSSYKLFDLWVNTCPLQGSRTIRTEEAVMISLAKINPFLIKSSHDKAEEFEDRGGDEDDDEEFSDESPSDESSEDEE